MAAASTARQLALPHGPPAPETASLEMIDFTEPHVHWEAAGRNGGFGFGPPMYGKNWQLVTLRVGLADSGYLQATLGGQMIGVFAGHIRRPNEQEDWHCRFCLRICPSGRFCNYLWECPTLNAREQAACCGFCNNARPQVSPSGLAQCRLLLQNPQHAAHSLVQISRMKLSNYQFDFGSLG